MKIEMNGGYGVYGKKVAKENSPAKESSSTATSKKAGEADVVSITRGNTTIADKGLTSLKANLQRDINQPASSERLEELRTAIKSGSYRIPTEALVDSLLGD